MAKPLEKEHILSDIDETVIPIERIHVLALVADLRDVDVLRQELKAAGIKPYFKHAASSHEFKGLIERFRFDLIIADHDLHFFEGIAALRFVRKRRPGTPLIFISKGVNCELAIDAIKSGAADFIPRQQISLLGQAAFRILSERQKEQEDKRAFEIAEARYHALFEFSSDVIAFVNKYGRVQDINQHVEELTGYEREYFIGKHISEMTRIFGPRAIFTMLSKFSKRMVGFKLKPYEVKAKNIKGETIVVEISGVPIKDASGKIFGEFVMMHDVTRRQQREEMLRSMSLTDELTGLNNRRGFLHLSHHALRLADRSHKQALMFYLDIDNMKDINDTRGHQAGDQALVETAEILRNTFRSADILSRIGGDEFCILTLQKTGNWENVLMDRLQKNLDARNAVGVMPFELSFSIGVAVYKPGKHCSLETLLDRADSFMYREKMEKKDSARIVERRDK